METNYYQQIFMECDKQRTFDHHVFERGIKFSKKISLEGRMHIYEFVMLTLQYLGLSKTIELGACNDLFSPYFEKYGCSKKIGMFALTLRHNPSLFIKGIFKPKRLKMALVDWVVNGDFHTYIINMIYEYPKKSNFEESLRKLECRIIRNSIIAGIKDESFWKSCYIMPKLIISEEDLNDLLISVTTSSNNDQKDSENQVRVLIPSEENMDTTSYYQQFDSEKADEECKNDNTSSLNTNSTFNNFISNNYDFNYYIFFNNVTYNNLVKKVKYYYYQYDRKNVSGSKDQKTSKDSINTEVSEQTSTYSQQQELGMVNERFEDTSILNIRFEEMNSYDPIKDDGPDLKTLYKFLVSNKIIDRIDYDTFEKCVSHAYFHPMYKNGAKVYILYTIRRLGDFYSKNWYLDVCKSINVIKNRVTKKNPNKDFINNFPSLIFKK